MIELINVSKRHLLGGGQVHALVDVSLRVLPGEFVAVVGTSGSGKSTLLNILGCLDRADAGTYLFNGLDVSKATDDQRAQLRSREIGFLFQDFNLLGRLTALQNVEQAMIYRNVGSKDRRQRALQLLSQVGLADRSLHLPAQLSGGQQQRVALARAIANSPAVIIADEPTGNLDSGTAQLVMGLLKAQHDSGRTLILVTHDESLAQRADRVFRMHDGRFVHRRLC